MDFDDDETLIPIYITAARQAAAKYTKRAFFNQTWQLSLDHLRFSIALPRCTRATRNRQDWPFYSSYYDGITIRLPRPTCASVTLITYLDLTGTTQTLPTNAYYVDTTSEPARIVPVPGTYCPYTQAYLPGSVQVTFMAGSVGDGVEVSKYPNTVVMAMMLLIGSFYECREDATLGNGVNVFTLPWGVKALLDAERFDYFS